LKTYVIGCLPHVAGRRKSARPAGQDVDTGDRVHPAGGADDRGHSDHRQNDERPVSLMFRSGHAVSHAGRRGLKCTVTVIPAPLTDFGYAGMLNDAEAGLYLTEYRAYDPTSGRWLSRDPLGETKFDVINLYNYANGDPLNGIDTRGLCTLQVGYATSGAFLGFTGMLGAGVAIDGQGNVGLYTYGGGGGTIGLAADGGLSVQYSNAPTVEDLSGFFTNYSLHGGVGVGGSADFFQGRAASNGQPIFGGGATVGAALGGSFTAGRTETAVLSRNGLNY